MDAATASSVSMVEALARLLPHCENKPHKVAARLDALHRDGDVGLLGGDTAIAPGANPSMLGVKAHIPPDGRAVLYIQIRKPLAGRIPTGAGESGPGWENPHKFGRFERKAFDPHFPDTPVPDAPVPNEPVLDTPDLHILGLGRPADYDVNELLIEALVYVSVKK